MNQLVIIALYIVSVSAQENVPFLTDPNTNNGITQLTDSVANLVECLTTPVTNDKYLGTIFRNDSYFCTLETQRLPQGVFCCTPQDTKELRLLLSTPDSEYSSYDIKFWDEKGSTILRQQKKVVYLAHGWIEKIATSPWLNQTRDGFLRRGYAVVVADWGHLNQLSYWQSIANLRTVGAAIGYSILKWNIPDKTLMVGFSLGGQIVGEVGKYVNQHGNGKQVAECHALDPAGPWFDTLTGRALDMQLDKSDCKVVQVIHSSASYNQMLSSPTFLTLKLGTAYKSGHCDYWINCGHDQGDLCHGDVNIFELIKDIATSYKDGGNKVVEFISEHVCSHYRSAMMYADAVNNRCSNNKPIASFCPDCGPTIPSMQGPRHDCTARPDQGTRPFPPDSVCSPNEDVNYVVFSTNQEPFCGGTQEMH